MVKKLTNVTTYLGILFIFVILVTGLISLGNEVAINPNADLDNDSIEYIANLQGINLSEYTAERSEIEQSYIIPGNETQGNPKDYALDFLYAKEKGFTIENTIKTIFSLPQAILVDLMRFNLNDWNWLIDLFNWLYRLLLLIAIVYFVRGILT